ncbi:EamA family transporter [Hoeflea sp. CAU 1731]
MNKLSPIDVIMGLLVAMVWGMGFVFAKAALDQFPPIFLMALRFSVTAVALVWFVRPPTGQLQRIFWIAVVSAAIQYSLTFNGLKGLDASVAVLVVQLEVPFLVLIGVLALGETPGIRKWIGISMAFVGVGLMMGEPKVGAAWVSVLLVIGGAFTWAIGQAMIRTLKEIDGLTATAWVAIWAAPQLFIMSFLLERNQLDSVLTAKWIDWTAVIYLGLVMTALGYALWYSLVRKHPVSQVAPFLLMLPVFSVAGSIAFLGERPTMIAFAGGAIVIAGLAFILIERPQSLAHMDKRVE